MTKQDERNKRFDEKFTSASFCWNGDNTTGLKFAESTKKKVKAHLNKEIGLAIAEERKRSAKIVEEMMEDHEHWKPIVDRILAS